MYNPLTALLRGSFIPLQHKQTYQSLYRGGGLFFSPHPPTRPPLWGFKYSLKSERTDLACLPN